MIPYADLKAQYLSIKDEIDQAVLKVLASSEFVLGSEVAKFEEEFAAYCGTKFAVGANSGTSALHLALLAAGVGPGDEVLTVPFTFVATTAAIRYTGAIPVYVDIDPETYCMDPKQLEQKITGRTRAIVPVHLYGQPADWDVIQSVAKKHNLATIEDAAQAHGAEYHGRRAGSLGDLGIFSFYPAKNLGACGEGGMVTTNNPEFARKLKSLRDWGAETKYRHVLKGFNYRMEGIQGAVLRVKLRHLEEWTKLRREHARRYTELLRGSEIETPREMDAVRHVYHAYTVRARNRRAAVERLTGRGIQYGIHYPIPLHRMEAHADLGYKAGDFPAAEQASEQVLSVPVYPELTEEQIEQVAETLRGETPKERRDTPAATARR